MGGIVLLKRAIQVLLLLLLSACGDQSAHKTSTHKPLASTGVHSTAVTDSVAPLSKAPVTLDQIAIIDARNDITQSPDPDYAFAENSVIRFPSGNQKIGIIIMGDSILTGWSGYFAHVFPNAFIDGRVGRQFSSAIEIWKILKEAQLTSGVGDVVVELGTNGPVSIAEMTQFMREVGPRQVFLVVPEVPRPWAQEVQSLYQVLPNVYPNVHLVRWDLLSRHHSSYFWPDGVHPNWLGIQVMVEAIARKMRQKMPLKSHSMIVSVSPGPKGFCR